MNVENIDIDALIELIKTMVYSFRQTIDDNLTNDDRFKDDTKPAVKEMLIDLTHDLICRQVELVLGIDNDSKKEYSEMREGIDIKVSHFINGEISLDDLILFIQNMYIELLKLESEDLVKRTRIILHKRDNMIGRQRIDH